MNTATLDLQSGITADSVRRSITTAGKHFNYISNTFQFQQQENISITTASKHFNYISFKSQSNHFKEKVFVKFKSRKEKVFGDLAEAWSKSSNCRKGY